MNSLTHSPLSPAELDYRRARATPVGASVYVRVLEDIEDGIVHPFAERETFWKRLITERRRTEDGRGLRGGPATITPVAAGPDPARGFWLRYTVYCLVGLALVVGYTVARSLFQEARS